MILFEIKNCGMIKLTSNYSMMELLFLFVITICNKGNTCQFMWHLV